MVRTYTGSIYTPVGSKALWELTRADLISDQSSVPRRAKNANDFDRKRTAGFSATPRLQEAQLVSPEATKDSWPDEDGTDYVPFWVRGAF